MKGTYTKYIIFGCCSLLLIAQGYSQNIYAQLRQQNAKQLIAQQIQHKYSASIQLQGLERPYCVPTNQVTVNIVMYHYIRPEHWDPAGSIVSNNSITPGQLQEHLAYLYRLQGENKTKVSFFSELQNRQDYNCFPQRHITLLTADDGRWDNYKYLAPLTQRYGLKFNLGLIYNKIAKDQSRIDPFMTYEEIQSILKTGVIEIQSHTLNHTNLRTLSYLEQYQEICASKIYLEQMFNTKINTLIYPMGKWDSNSLTIARSCGYTYGLTTVGGTVDAHELQTTPLTLQRTRVSKESTPEELFGK